jgi:hypothetical protein
MRVVLPAFPWFAIGVQEAAPASRPGKKPAGFSREYSRFRYMLA